MDGMPSTGFIKQVKGMGSSLMCAAYSLLRSVLIVSMSSAGTEVFVIFPF